MPEWKDKIILLSSKPFGETGMLVSVLSKYNGRYKSFVYGGNSIKKRSIFQKEIYAELNGKQEYLNKWVQLNWN